LVRAYARQARIAPVLFVSAPLLPLACTAVASLPGWSKISGGAWLVLAYAVQEFGRDRGLRLQDRLWTAWGGAPTTQLLRWRTSNNVALTAERHRLVASVVGPALKLPNKYDEIQNPEAADRMYEAAVTQLRALTREKDSLLEAENASYGFRRNCLGLRPWGITSSLLGLALGAAPTWLTLGENAAMFSFSAAIAVCGGLFWLLVVREDWVKRQAFSYAAALFTTTAKLFSLKSPGLSSTPPLDDE
jgi:hypothetical protein